MDGMESVFFTAACRVLCFGFVTDAVLIRLGCFGCC